MSLIKCTECNQEISDKASTCPNCGCPVQPPIVTNEEKNIDYIDTIIDEIVRINSKDKIKAIKEISKVTGLSLKEAKSKVDNKFADFSENHIQNNINNKFDNTTSNINQMNNSKKKRSKGKYIVIAIVVIIIFIAVNNKDSSKKSSSDADATTVVETTVEETTVPETTLSPEEQAAVDYKNWVDSQFSLWNGSCKALVQLVKENMNDPDSFKHVETSYGDRGTGVGFDVYMKYRGTNAFGGVVTNEVTAFVDYQAKTVTITSNQ